MWLKTLLLLDSALFSGTLAYRRVHHVHHVNITPLELAIEKVTPEGLPTN